MESESEDEDGLSAERGRFQPLPDIPVNTVHQLNQITSRYQTVKEGLPELVKNSKDHYARLDVEDPDLRQIVVLISPDMERLGVLDFGGASPEDFKEWLTWSDPDAGRQERSAHIEAGHGNGGKAFMAGGATREAFMAGYTDGEFTKMGFKNDVDEHSYKPGWYELPGGEQLDGYPLDEPPEAVLDAALQMFDLSSDDLPEPALRAFRERESFTLVVLKGVRDWDTSRPEPLVQRVPEDLATHSQAALSLEMCRVWIQRGDSLLIDEPLSRDYPPPHSAFESERIPVPDELEDPATGTLVETGRGDKSDKYLEVRTCATSLRASGKTDLNVIRVKNERNIVANWSVPAIVPRAPAGFLYGSLKVPSLDREHMAGTGRQELSDTPLTRALKHWTAQQIQPLTDQIQTAQAGQDSPKERQTSNEALDRMRALMRDYLEDETDDPGGQEFGPSIDEITLESGRDTLTVPVGTKVPLKFRCYEIDGPDRLPIRNPSVELEAENAGLVDLTESGELQAKDAGTTTIHLKSEDGDTRSRNLEVRCRKISKLHLEGPNEPMKQGGWTDLKIEAEDNQGNPVDGAIYQITVDELDMGRVSRTGRFTAGRVEGTATIRLHYSDTEVETCNIEIGPEKTEKPEPKTGDIPHLLTCGTPAPGTEELPKEQRTHPGGEDYPTIIDNNPLWRNVVWLNPQSHESQRFRSQRGPTGAVGLDTKLWTRFMAMKCFEVLKRLRARQELQDQHVTPTQFFREMSTAEMDCSEFVEEAFELVEDIL